MKQLESLRGRKAFQAIRGDGRVFEGDLLKVFYILQTNQQTRCRIAVVVNKRHGVAACRNLIKRRIRESCRLEVGHRAVALQSMRVVFSAVVVYKGSKRRPAVSIFFEDVRNDVVKFLEVIQSSTVSK